MAETLRKECSYSELFWSARRKVRTRITRTLFMKRESFTIFAASSIFDVWKDFECASVGKNKTHRHRIGDILMLLNWKHALKLVKDKCSSVALIKQGSSFKEIMLQKCHMKSLQFHHNAYNFRYFFKISESLTLWLWQQIENSYCQLTQKNPIRQIIMSLQSTERVSITMSLLLTLSKPDKYLFQVL